MSGRKSFLHRFQLITAGDMTGNLTSPVISLQGLDNVGLQFNVAAGTPTGTLSCQVSADYDQIGPTVTNVGNWITLTTQTITSGSPTNTYFDLNQLSSQWIRLTYAASSGTGTGTAFATGKMI